MKQAAALLFAALLLWNIAGVITYADSQVEEPASEEAAPAESAADPEAEAAEGENASDAEPEADGGVPALTGEKAVLIEAETGRILFGQDPEVPASPASMTKIMTGYLAATRGNLSDKVTVTAAGVSMAYSGSANQFIEEGEIFTLEQLLYGTLVYSANDMATQIAEYIGGTVDGFVEIMNQTAADLGCENTHFANACGYPDDDNYASAHDIAKILSAAIENDMFRTIIGTKSYVIPPTNKINIERPLNSRILLLTDPNFACEGVIGGKTGFTDIAGNCLAAACERDGMTLIAVVMHAPTVQEAAADVVSLFEYGYANFEKADITVPEFPDHTGTAVLRKGTGTDGLLLVESTHVTAEGEQVHVFEYYEEDEAVGRVEIPEEEYQAWVEATQEPSEPEEPEPEVTETPEPTPTPVYVEERKRLEFPRNFEYLMVWLDDGANRLLFIIVILIIIAFIFAFVRWVKELGRRRRRRRRRRQQKKKNR